jgi:uncharacterized membrane protein
MDGQKMQRPQREDGRANGAPIPAFDPTKNNVEAIAKLEHAALLERSLGERISDGITRTVGTAGCVVLHVVWFITWALVNSGAVPHVPVFDPFPFGILTLIVSSEGVLLSIFILVSQNRMSRQADRRAHLDLQVSMLAEQELTLMLQLQKRLCDRFGIQAPESAAEVQQFMEKTDVRHLVDELNEQLPDE